MIDVSGYVATEVIDSVSSDAGASNADTFVARLLQEMNEEDPFQLQQLIRAIYAEAFEEMALELLVSKLPDGYILSHSALKQFINTNGFSSTGTTAFEWYSSPLSKSLPFIGAAVSGGFEYFNEDNENEYWMERWSNTIFAASGGLAGSAATLACGGNIACGIGTSAIFDTYGQAALDRAGARGGTVLYERFGVYNPDKTFWQGVKESGAEAGGYLLSNPSAILRTSPLSPFW
jgi:hypothetical protein